MTNKIKELVAAGHALAKELHCSESAALVRELATQLDVQRARADVLAVDNENALSVLKEANLSVLRAKASFEAMSAENDAARHTVQAFCDVVGDNTDAICEEVGQEGARIILAAMQATGNMPETDAYLAEVRHSAIKTALDDCSEYLDRDCIMDSNGISYEDAALREAGAMALQNALLHKGGAK